MFVYHPTARGKRVLEAYPQARPFFEALAASQDGFVREAADVLGTGAENPWALVRKTGGGWWLVPSWPMARPWPASGASRWPCGA